MAEETNAVAGKPVGTAKQVADAVNTAQALYGKTLNDLKAECGIPATQPFEFQKGVDQATGAVTPWMTMFHKTLRITIHEDTLANIKAGKDVDGNPLSRSDKRFGLRWRTNNDAMIVVLSLETAAKETVTL